MLVVGLEVAEGHSGEGTSSGCMHVLVRVPLQSVHTKMPEVDLQEGRQEEKLEDVVEQKDELDHQVQSGQVAAHVAAYAQRTAGQGLLQYG